MLKIGKKSWVTVYIYIIGVCVMRDEGVHRREREDEMIGEMMKRRGSAILHPGVTNSFTSATRTAIG